MTNQRPLPITMIFLIAVSLHPPALLAKAPNVLFISIEDMSPYLGCYGYTDVSTPHIDKLATQGIVFRRAYCQAPLCNSSRASVFTGLRPETTRVFGNSEDWRVHIPDGWQTLPEFFKRHGYETIRIGKMHHNAKAFDHRDPKGDAREAAMWDRTLQVDRAPAKEPAQTTDVPIPEAFKSDSNYDFLMRSLNWGPTGLEPDEQRDAVMAREASKIFHERRERPFFLGVGLQAPHYPFRAPNRFQEMYGLNDFTLPNYPADDLEDVPIKYPLFNTADEARLTEMQKRDIIRSYLACISYTDYCVGILLDELKKAGRDKDTVICLWSDHGLHLGEHGLWRKYTLFEESCRVALIFADPRMNKRGLASDKVVELVDIYPTLGELCGLPLPQGLEGSSLIPLMQDPQKPWKEAAFSTIRRGYFRKPVSIRTERWRYTEWDNRQHVELYDHENDPLEITNLGYDPQYAEVRQTLHEIITNR